MGEGDNHLRLEVFKPLVQDVAFYIQGPAGNIGLFPMQMRAHGFLNLPKKN